MDREISFRGKRLDNGEWVYGSLIQMDEEGSQSFIFPFYKHASSLACDQIVSMFMVAINPAAVGQFTGFCDKNGVRIFEGDIVDIWSAGQHCYGLVKWGKVRFPSLSKFLALRIFGIYRAAEKIMTKKHAKSSATSTITLSC